MPSTKREKTGQFAKGTAAGPGRPTKPIAPATIKHEIEVLNQVARGWSPETWASAELAAAELAQRHKAIDLEQHLGQLAQHLARAQLAAAKRLTEVLESRKL